MDDYADWNTITESGYYLSSGYYTHYTNAPKGYLYGILRVYRLDSGQLIQIHIEDAEPSAILGELIGINDTWLRWRAILDDTANFDNIKGSGVYRCGPNVPNKPSKYDYGLLVVIGSSSLYDGVVQVFFPHVADEGAYFRVSYDSKWQKWCNI